MSEDLPKVNRNLYSLYLKRIIDIVGSFCGILCLSPVYLVVSILVLIYHGRPIFYKTPRPGKDGKIFYLYKFRSMTNDVDSDGWLLPEEKRLTNFGRFIRRTSIDELPELFNILKGDMSIIGPRPLLVEYLKYYSPRHSCRHLVRPGLACVRIQSTDSKTWTWREQFENDIYYIENLSFWVDVQMLIAIIKIVFKHSENREQANRAPFIGTNLDETRNADEVDYKLQFESIGRVN